MYRIELKWCPTTTNALLVLTGGWRQVESDYWFSPNPRAFGHTGAGGASVGFADPEAQLSFGYTANRFDQSASYDGAERRKHIIRAVYAVLARGSSR